MDGPVHHFVPPSLMYWSAADTTYFREKNIPGKPCSPCFRLCPWSFWRNAVRTASGSLFAGRSSVKSPRCPHDRLNRNLFILHRVIPVSSDVGCTRKKRILFSGKLMSISFVCRKDSFYSLAGQIQSFVIRIQDNSRYFRRRLALRFHSPRALCLFIRQK